MICVKKYSHMFTAKDLTHAPTSLKMTPVADNAIRPKSCNRFPVISLHMETLPAFLQGLMTVTVMKKQAIRTESGGDGQELRVQNIYHHQSQ